MRQKGFAPILIIVIVLIAIGGAYYFGAQKDNFLPIQTQIPTSVATATPAQTSPVARPTTDPTANWKMFTNTKYFYSFKYPGGHTVVVNGMNSPDIEIQPFIIVSNPDAKNENSIFTLSVMWASDKTLQTRAQEHFDKVSNYVLTQNPQFPTYQSNKAVINITKTTFLGKEAYTYTITGSYVEDGASEGISPPLERKYIWVNHNGNDILIRIDNNSLTDQILSTFKFTN